jgi:osmotically-inducible protein OsmY
MKTDLEIQKDVMEELKFEPILNASEIGVAVKNEIVTLSGTVDTFSKKVAAERAAKKVAGVRAVALDIDVKLSSFGKKNDTEIAQTVLNAIKWHSTLKEDKIKVKVEDGWVTLEGEVEWEFQRIAARTLVEDLLGVTGITNLLKVTPKLSSKEIKQKISFAFHRSATIDSEKVSIEAIGNKVILTGKVRSWAEKKDAENAAWAAPGVSSVDNNIVIDTEIFAY